MTEERKRKLEKNFFKIFFVNALLNVKMINIVVSLFYVYRSLAVADVFYLGIVYAVAVILSEVPSSYLADRFGRKRTIIMAGFFGLLHWVFFLTAGSFLFFSIGIIFYALAESFMSGTDEAFVYDTNKELGNANKAFKQLSRYLSSERIFKIVSAFLAALIAKDLAGWQFNLIIMVDIVATVVATIFAFTLTEPDHYMDVEKQEAGILKDAYVILSKDRNLLSVIFNKVIIMIMTMTLWRYSAVLFIQDLRVPIIIFGFIWSIYHILVFVGNYFSHAVWPAKSDGFKIFILNATVCVALILFLIVWFFYPEKYILFALYTVILTAGSLRDPFFSNLFNRQFKSYNRATSLSLANFLLRIIEIPFLPLAALLVSGNNVYPYIAALILTLLTIFYFRINEKKLIQQNYEPKII